MSNPKIKRDKYVIDNKTSQLSNSEETEIQNAFKAFRDKIADLYLG
tara:strand:- start:1699 stop:1836 length:138 start_codon:yes stop_codon:yes gene_type:complete